MRIHPGQITPGLSKWQLPLAGGLLLLLLIVMAFRGSKETTIVQQPVMEKRLDVVVAQARIEAGQPLENAKLVMEQRPVSTLPADAITSLQVLKGKVAAGPIPAGYPLAMALLADPVVVLPVENKPEPEVMPEDPVDTLLRQIESETVALPVTFTSAPPPRGSRVAVTLSNMRGESVVVVEECWVASSSKDREATLRLEPAKALLLQSARKFGNFGFIALATEGPSPYAGQAVSSLEDLKSILEGKGPVQVVKKENNTSRMKGYAWISGEGRRYGIDNEGQIHVMGAE